MKVFLAGVESLAKENKKLIYGRYNLISYYSINKSNIDIIRNSSIFLLDSGAFSFMRSSKSDLNWDEYIESYSEFIKDNNISNFFELDIDNVVGYENVKKYRKRLEKLTGKQCIPVWHKQRGFDEFRKMCDEYDYVALGGLAIKEIKRTQYKVLPRLIDEAHKRNAKIHGLGFTSTKLLKCIKFDSVDSTNWSYGRYGHHWVFMPNGEMVMISRNAMHSGKRCSNRNALQAYNLSEWIKFQKYAEENL